MPEPTPCSRAAYDAVATTPRSVGSPATTDHHRQPDQLGPAQHLHGRDEVVEVDVEDRRLLGVFRGGDHRSRLTGGIASVASERVHAGQQQQIRDHRPHLGQDHLRRQVVGPLHLTGGDADGDQRPAGGGREAFARARS